MARTLFFQPGFDQGLGQGATGMWTGQAAPSGYFGQPPETWGMQTAGDPALAAQPADPGTLTQAPNPVLSQPHANPFATLADQALTGGAIARYDASPSQPGDHYNPIGAVAGNVLGSMGAGGPDWGVPAGNAIQPGALAQYFQMMLHGLGARNRSGG